MLATLTTAALITVSPMLWGSEGNNEENFFIKTATGTPAAETDFTEAAKNTIDCVVSIKSFATPRQQSISPFSDPFFEFFFGPGAGNSHRELATANAANRNQNRASSDSAQV